MSDVHNLKSDLGLPAESECVGHEGAGRVVAMGAAVQDWAIGDRAGVKVRAITIFNLLILTFILALHVRLPEL